MTKAQLIEECAELRTANAELQGSLAKSRAAEQKSRDEARKARALADELARDLRSEQTKSGKLNAECDELSGLVRNAERMRLEDNKLLTRAVMALDEIKTPGMRRRKHLAETAAQALREIRSARA